MEGLQEATLSAGSPVLADFMGVEVSMEAAEVSMGAVEAADSSCEVI
jgi:hypothetical protein